MAIYITCYTPSLPLSSSTNGFLSTRISCKIFLFMQSVKCYIYPQCKDRCSFVLRFLGEVDLASGCESFFIQEWRAPSPKIGSTIDPTHGRQAPSNEKIKGFEELSGGFCPSDSLCDRAENPFCHVTRLDDSLFPEYIRSFPRRLLVPDHVFPAILVP